MAITRRHLMQAGGAGLLAAPSAFGAFEEFFQPASAASTADIKKLITCCGFCTPACGMQVTLRNNVPVFAEGLPGDAHGAGHLCGKGASILNFAYDPDRLKYPMKRTNPRRGLDEDPGFVRITWDEALNTIAERFQRYMTDHGRDSILFLSRNSPDLLARLVNALGIINRVDHNDICYTADQAVRKYTTGGKTWCEDFENARYIVLFGWDLVAKNKLPGVNGILAAREKGVKVIHFSPNQTPTSRMASEWISVRPGSDPAIALAMINVMLTENLYDRDFVNNYTNFPQYESEIRSHFAQYTPEWAAPLCDVPAATIRRIAQEFGRARGMAPAYKKTLTANYTNATQMAHAQAILQILTGTIDREGGNYFARTHSVPGVDAVYPPPAYPQKLGRRIDGRDKLFFANDVNQGMFATLADGMLRRYPGLIKGAFINAYDIKGFAQPLRMVEALKTVEFIATFDFLPSDTVNLSDIVLPAGHQLESNDIITRNFNAKYPQSVVRQSVAGAYFEARGTGAVAIELGKRLAPDYFKTPDGAWIAGGTLLNEKTKRAGLGENFAEFRAKGVVEDRRPFVPRTTFNAPNSGGKCQIYVPQFKDKGFEPLPHWHAKREQPSAEYPFYYVTYIPGTHRRNTTQNCSILHEIMPTNHVTIHPATAARHGIQEGNPVRIRSRVGAIELPAHLSRTVREDMVLVPHGFGHRSRSLGNAANKGARDGDVIPDLTPEEMLELMDFGGSGAIMDAVVQIEKLRS
ncbi:MAG: molybdopterin-dependent oxidoreductase [Bryobacteraceae bacterium]|nr:molybdopterin-dependent oxidoreductase [Bryobacteraceae bacterium]